MKWPWQRKEENRVRSQQAVRIDKRERMPAYENGDLGDIEFNKRRAAELARKARQEGDG